MNTLVLDACKKCHESYGNFEAKGTPKNIGLWFAYEKHLVDRNNLNEEEYSYFSDDSYEEWFHEERCQILIERASQIRDDILNPTIFKYHRDQNIKMNITSWFVLVIGDVLHVEHIAVCMAMAENRYLARKQEPVNYDWYSTWLSSLYGDVNDEVSLLTKLIKDVHMSIEDIVVEVYLKKQ
jgi:hypothetical protein